MRSENEPIQIIAEFTDVAIPVLNAPRRKRSATAAELDYTRKLILRFGTNSLGAPQQSISDALAAITDLERLENLLEQVAHVKTWQELLAAP